MRANLSVVVIVVAVVVAVVVAAPALAGAPRYWARPMTLEVWPREDGAPPGAAFSLYEIACLDDATGPQRITRCTDGADATPEERSRDARIAQCFALTKRPAPDALVRAVDARFRALSAGPTTGATLQAERDAVAPVEGAFVAVTTTHKQLVDEVRGAGCENGPSYTPDGHMIGCDPVVVPTGRKTPSTTRQRVVVDPRSAHEAGVYQSQRLDVFYVWIGTWTDHFEMDTSIAPSSTLSIPAPAEALPLLERARRDGPAERRAAVLVDIAIASFRLADLARGKQAVADLDALIAAEHVDGKSLDGTLAASLVALHAVAAGTWALRDPCAR